MKKVGYSLIDENDIEIKFWGNNLGEDMEIPNPLFLPNGDVVHAPKLGYFDNLRLVERWIDGDEEKQYLKIADDIKSFDGEKMIVQWQYRLPNEQEYANEIQKYVDNIARSKQYNDAISLSSYVNSTNQLWKQEAEIFTAWRDSVWVFVFNKMDEVKQGISEQPTLEELIASLPQITW